jgi:hypothetical protein
MTIADWEAGKGWLPGHPYDAQLGSGLKWHPEHLELWLAGRRLGAAACATASPQVCWGELRFVEAFPQASHWWFSSPWTQRVRAVDRGTRADGTRLVWLQAVDATADALCWEVPPGGVVNGPLPRYAGDARNIVLRRWLGEVVRQVEAGQVAIGDWVIVTSLAEASALRFLMAGHEAWMLGALGLTDAVGQAR